MKNIHRIIFLLSLTALVSTGQAQNFSDVEEKFDAYRSNNLQEKIYVHIDREFHITGELIWFKVYCVDGTNHRPLDMSKVAYIEIVDAENNVFLQAKVALKGGYGNGSLFIPTTVPSGSYLLRAYTQWMRNFDPEFYFQKEIQIANTFRKLSTVEPVGVEEKPDVQFFPEGGNLVHGVESRVAFKGVLPNNKSFSFTGTLLGGSGDSLLHFSSAHLGMGVFELVPDKSTQYQIIIEDANGLRYSYDFPKVFEEGYVLSVHEDKESIRVKVNASRDRIENLYLLVHCRGERIIGQTLRMDGKSLDISFKKEELGQGINHLTLLDRDRNPLCERLYFNTPTSRMYVKSEFRNEFYSSGEQVAFQFDVTDDKQAPMPANLSVSVYHLDSLNTKSDMDIFSYLMLNSDLVGFIESPMSYFSENFEGRNELMDVLMLTHGWRRFKWEEIFDESRTPPSFIPEYRGPIVRAKLFHKKNGAPAEGIYGYLSIPGKVPNIGVAESDARGILTFEMNSLMGARAVHFQTEQGDDSLYTVEMVSPFSDEFADFPSENFEINPRFEKELLERSIGMQTRNVYFQEEINTFLPSADSLPFYSNADKTYFLDDYTRFTIMEDVMREYVPEIWVRKRDGKFHFLTLDSQYDIMYKENPMAFYDGIPIFDFDRIMEIDPLKIRKMDIMTRKYFLGPMTFHGLISYSSYKGNLDGLELRPTDNIISYEGLQLQREFYQPKFGEDERRLPDYRNLLYWNPEVTSDESGKAMVEFTTSDVKGSYIIVVEGISSEGTAGSGTFSFQVQNENN